MRDIPIWRRNVHRVIFILDEVARNGREVCASGSKIMKRDKTPSLYIQFSYFQLEYLMDFVIITHRSRSFLRCPGANDFFLAGEIIQRQSNTQKSHFAQRKLHFARNIHRLWANDRDWELEARNRDSLLLSSASRSSADDRIFLQPMLLADVIFSPAIRGFILQRCRY